MHYFFNVEYNPIYCLPLFMVRTLTLPFQNIVFLLLYPFVGRMTCVFRVVVMLYDLLSVPP